MGLGCAGLSLSVWTMGGNWQGGYWAIGLMAIQGSAWAGHGQGMGRAWAGHGQGMGRAWSLARERAHQIQLAEHIFSLLK